MTAHLDTHVAAWLYAGRLDLLPPAVLNRLEDDDLAVSPMVALELDYLFELDRVGEGAGQVLAALRRDLGLVVCDLPFEQVVAAASRLRWTRDPFDRLIAAQAAARGAVLLTKDRAMREHCDWAAWG